MQKLESMLDSMPDYAKDMKLNAKSILLADDNILTKKQIGIIAIASAVKAKNKELFEAILEYFKPELSESEIDAARTAASIMGMNNVYYRFNYMASNKEYEKMPAGLRMNGLVNHGIEKTDFELASIACSAIEGCAACVDSHESILKQNNISAQQIQFSIKIASVINGLSCSLL